VREGEDGTGRRVVLSTGAIAVEGTVELAQGSSGPALGSVRGVGCCNGAGVAAQAREMRNQKTTREAMRQCVPRG
jgi:hypothetical protein